MSGEKDRKVTVDIGLAAKATLEAKVSTEIPAQSTGRLLDALTDIIRPFSERRGLKADQIRLQREEVLIEIARRAHRRLEIENRPVNPLPNKFLVPFLEKASLEELDSVMLDRWSDLLASCSATPASAHPRFIQILSELGADEAQLLRRIALNNIEEYPKVNIEICDKIYRAIHMTELLYGRLNIRTKNDKELKSLAEGISNWALTAFHRPGILLAEAIVSYRTGGKLGGNPISSFRVFPHLPDIPKPNDVHSLPSINILLSLGLLIQQQIDIIDDRFASSWISYCYLTPLAADFLKKCDRNLEQQLLGAPTTAT